MEQSKKIIWINLAILLTYTVVIQFLGQVESDLHYKAIFVLGFTMYAILAHLAVNILIAIFYFFKNDRDKGQVFFLNSLIILLVGFSACWGSALLV